MHDSSVLNAFVVSPIRLYREGLARALELSNDIHVVGTARSARDAEQSLMEKSIRVLLLDVPRSQRAEAVERTCRIDNTIRVVAFGIREDEDEIIGCAQAGVAGFVGPESSIEDLTAAVRGVLRGDVHCSPHMAGMLFRCIRRERVAEVDDLDAANVLADGCLTKRESEALALVGRGLSNKEIASSLHIAVPTVKNHLHSAFQKLHVRGRGEAVALMAGRQRNLTTG